MTNPVDPAVACMQCRNPVPLNRFRVFSQVPLRFYDFCTDCESAYGVRTLYENHGRRTTKEIHDHVMADTIDEVSAAVQASADERKQEMLRELANRELSRKRLVFF